MVFFCGCSDEFTTAIADGMRVSYGLFIISVSVIFLLVSMLWEFHLFSGEIGWSLWCILHCWRDCSGVLYVVRMSSLLHSRPRLKGKVWLIYARILDKGDEICIGYITWYIRRPQDDKLKEDFNVWTLLNQLTNCVWRIHHTTSCFEMLFIYTHVCLVLSWVFMCFLSS